MPVVQLSINALQPFEYHLELGARLAPLRERGVLIVGSGNVVHNLRAMDWRQPEAGYDWALRFDEAVREVMERDPADILSITRHPDYAAAVPTPDHFLPLIYIAGVGSVEGERHLRFLTPTPGPGRARVLVHGCTFGAISMTSYGVGCAEVPVTQGAGAAGVPSGVPADQANI